MGVEAATFHFTVEDYHKLGEAGVLGEDDRVELLDGELVVMSPIGYRHARTVQFLNKFFVQHARDRYEVSPQNPVLLSNSSEPQPDLLLLRLSPELYETDNPLPNDVLLLIEVADASLPYDRGSKLRAYARAGIAEFWIVNLTKDVVETYREPQDETYHSTARWDREQTVGPLAFPDLLLKVSEIIP